MTTAFSRLNQNNKKKMFMSTKNQAKTYLVMRQLQFLKQYLPSTIISLFIATSLTTWLIWSKTTQHELLVIWYSGICLLLAIRAYLYFFYIPTHEVDNPQQCIFLISSSAILNGLFTISLVFLLPDNPDIWAYISLLIAVMVISAIVTLGVKLKVFYVFLCITTLPVLVFKTVQINQIDYFHFFMISIVLIFIVITAQRYHASLINVFLMENETQQLKAELTTEKSKREFAQAQLERQAKELQELNDNLENKVKEKTQELNVIAFYDQLTQLPNRHSFYSYFQRTLVRHLHSLDPFHLLFIDLDEFKNINDNLGHDTGDQLLIQVAERLKFSVRADDFVARVGGDEFAVILKAKIGRSELSSIAEKIIRSISKPYQLDKKQSYISCSIGISAFPQDGDDIHQLIKHADLSMYQAKENGKNGFHFFNISLYEKKARRFIIENELKSAIANHELHLVFQPQVNLENEQIENMEALLRWENHELGFVSPADFIPIAEDSNLILELEDWVLDQALSQVKQWAPQLPHPIRVAVNISGIHFKQSNFAQHIEAKLEQWQVDGSILEIELTESSIMDNTSTSIAKLAQLKSLGIHTSIDDFGTGYSSMSYLKQLPIDKLKIDKSFVDGIPRDQHDMAIVKAIIELAKQFDLITIAEGVEEQAQKDYLSTIGCQYIQGYFYFKPLDKNQFEQIFIKKTDKKNAKHV